MPTKPDSDAPPHIDVHAEMDLSRPEGEGVETMTLDAFDAACDAWNAQTSHEYSTDGLIAACEAYHATMQISLWRPIATFDADHYWVNGGKVLISGRLQNGARWAEEGYFIGHHPGGHSGHWSGHKFDGGPDIWMPFPMPEDAI